MSSTLHPLRGDDDETGPLCPEALLISAYLELGSFSPRDHHVTDSDIWAWSRLWTYCNDYQAQAGSAPPISLIKRAFPDFELTTDVSADWAANQVRNNAAQRQLRSSIAESLTHLGQEDLESAYGALSGLQRPRGFRKPAADVLDHASIAEEFELAKMGVPWPSLAKATGGIGPAELWYIGARFGHGKTWTLLQFAKVAAEAGYRCIIHSLEMPHKKLSARAHALLAGPDMHLLSMLRGSDIGMRKTALDEIALRTPGSIHVIDPSHGRINTCAAVAESARDYDFVLVDHMGLMLSPDGHRGVEDWRYAATITNILREVSLETNTPIMGAVQINREGENNSPYPPKASKMANTDALGQDADVAVTMKKLCKTVQVFSADKVRDGEDLYWYTRFDVRRNRFEEISKDTAYEIKGTETDVHAND